MNERKNPIPVLPVPTLPPIREHESPKVVLILDRIRRELDERDGLEEFCWFAREYPRCYRFHLNGADFRLRTMHGLLRRVYTELAESAIDSTEDMFEVATGNEYVDQLYWDFESYLSEINVALDLLARVVGPAFEQESPPSFNKLCKQNQQHVIIDLFQKAQRMWVQRLKDYRDCFMHYTPVDTLLVVTLRKYQTGWEIRAKLPVNPNVREILGFRYSRRVELMRYAITTHKHLATFDRTVAEAIWRLYRNGNFPVRKNHLFFVGRRSR